MTAYLESTLLADLMMGYEVGRLTTAGPDTANRDTADYEVLYAHAVHLKEVVDHLRHQVRLHVHTVRAWRGHHQRLRLSVSRKYSALEGLLRGQDLRQRWILYRCSMRELHSTRRLCNHLVDQIIRTKHAEEESPQ